MSETKRIAPHNVVLLLVVAAVAIYLSSVVLPFFLLGLDQQPADLVRGGLFDPKDYPLTGGWLRVVGILAVVIAPIMVVVLSGAALLWAVRHRALLMQRTRVSIGLSILIAAGLWVFILSPPGRLILTWFMD